MLKCNSCGAENDDEQKFCSECGAKLAAEEQPKAAEEPSAVQHESEAAATEKVCPACGAKNEPTEKFCSECGKPLDAAETAKEEPKKEHKNKFVGTVVGVKDKTMAFENKHHLIGNVLVAVMALVVILVSLLAPVKYTQYSLDKMDIMSVNAQSDYGDIDEGDIEAALEEAAKPRRVDYLEVDQSIFNALGAVFALTTDYKKAVEDMAKMEDEIEAAFVEYEIAILAEATKIYEKHPDWDEEKIFEELMPVMKKEYNKAFKGINWFKYDVLDFTLQFKKAASNLNAAQDGADNVDEAADEAKEKTQAMMSLMSSLMSTVITAIIRIILAIVALVYLIKAIIRIVKKEPSDNALFKLLCTTMCTMAACVAIESFSSGLHVGGGAFALMLTCAILAFVLGSVNALVNKVHTPLTVLKNAIIGLLITVGYFLLCTDFIAYKTKVNGEVVSSQYGPLGWAMFKGLDAIFDAVGSGSAAGVANGALTGVGLTVSGYLITILFLVTIWLLGVGVARRLRYNACGVVMRKNGTSVKDAYGTRAIITGIVFGIISILATLIGSPALIKGLADAVEEGTQGAVSGLEATGAFSLRAQVFISIIFTLVAMIFSAVFKPENFGKKEEKPAAEAAA